MSQMLRSGRDIRRPSAARKSSSAGPVPGSGSARPAAATPASTPSPQPELESLLPLELSPTGEPVDPAAPGLPASEVYQQLLRAAEQLFAAAREHRPPDSASLIEAVRTTLAQLQQGGGLLAETVRQRGESSWPQRAANVAILGIRIGLELGYDERRALGLGLCGLMHDVGMLTLPEELFDRPQLSPEQVELLRRHPFASQEIVGGFGKAFAWVAKIVVQVHERQDGSGYPLGLRGEQIHEFARIIGLADTYEAMAHPRADRGARAVYTALKEIIDLRHTHFDRQLVKALISIVSIFPLGSLVKLNNGEIGRVMATSRTHPTRPTVEVLTDPQGRPAPEAHLVVLEEEPMLYIVDPAIEESVLQG